MTEQSNAELMDHICGWILPSGEPIRRSECAACAEERKN